MKLKVYTKMTLYDKIKDYLEKEPRARERHLRDRAMVNLLLQKYEFGEVGASKEMLVNFCHDFESYCRIWRQVTERNEHLRGLDYGSKDGTKTILEQDKMLELGYEPNYHRDVKQLELL